MKVILVEDELAAARRLQKMLADIDPGIEVLQVLDSIASAVRFFRDPALHDLVFMDIHLADGACFSIFGQVEVKSPVVFTTAYDAYALQAFQVHAIDYLLKPIRREELERALDKYRRLQVPATQDFRAMLREWRDQGQDSQPRRFLVRIGQHIRVIDQAEAAYFYTEEKITFLVTGAGKRYPVDFTLEQLEKMLPVVTFFRVNRQFIIRIDAIREMYAHSKSRVKVVLKPDTDQEVIVSSERAAAFKKWLTGEPD